MSLGKSRDGQLVIERWDRVFEALCAEPRRQLVVSLMDARARESVSLPAAAQSPDVPENEDVTTLNLQHQHLPLLAEGGYVQWDRDPFQARRGPHFDELAVVIGSLHTMAGEIPDQLVYGCSRLETARSTDDWREYREW